LFFEKIVISIVMRRCQNITVIAFVCSLNQASGWVMTL